MELNGRTVSRESLLVEGVDRTDYPDFCDSYWSYGTYTDGTELTSEELEQLASKYSSELYEDAFESTI